MCQNWGGYWEGWGGNWLWLDNYFSWNSSVFILIGFLMGAASNVCIFEGYRLCKVHGANGIDKITHFLIFHCLASLQLSYPPPTHFFFFFKVHRYNLLNLTWRSSLFSSRHGFGEYRCYNENKPTNQPQITSQTNNIKTVARRFAYTELITRFHTQPSKGGIFLSGEGWNSGGAPPMKSFLTSIACSTVRFCICLLSSSTWTVKMLIKHLKWTSIKHMTSNTIDNQTLWCHPLFLPPVAIMWAQIW